MFKGLFLAIGIGLLHQTTLCAQISIKGDIFLQGGTFAAYSSTYIDSGSIITQQDGSVFLFFGDTLSLHPSTEWHGFDGFIQQPTGTGLLLFSQPNPSTMSTSTQYLDGGNNNNILNEQPQLLTLAIDNLSGLKLIENNTYIGTALQFADGNLILDDKNIKFGEQAFVNGFGSNAYIETSGTGFVAKELLGAGQSFYFPIGRAANDYTPFNITNTGLGAETFFSKVKNYAECGASITNPYEGMDRAWQIFSETGSSASIALQHNSITNNPGSYTTTGGDAVAFITRYNGGGLWSDGAGAGITDMPGTEVGSRIHTRDFTTTATSAFASESWYSKSTDLISPLPVALSTFTSMCSSHEVAVEWTTESELNSDKFILEKSTDLIQWETISEITAAGNSNQSITYHYTDIRPAYGMIYYRLVQLDWDGSETYYGPINTSCLPSENNNTISLYPNPSIAYFTLRVAISTTATEDALITISDMNGKNMYNTKVQYSYGENSYTFDISNYAPGTYIVQFLSPSHEFKPQKLIIY